MSYITLSAGVRQNLLSLQPTAKQLCHRRRTRLATGKKVNSALDNANEYFTSQGLTNRANSLSGLLDGITNGINTIQAANNGITAITKLVQSAQSLVTQAQQTSDTTVRSSLATQYGAILTQIDQLAGDSGYNGTNLLSGNSPHVDAQRDRHVDRDRYRRHRHLGRPFDRGRVQALGPARPISPPPRPSLRLH